MLSSSNFPQVETEGTEQFFTVTLQQSNYICSLFSANEDFQVDQRIIDMVRDSYSEDKSGSDEVTQRPKSSSFMSRSGSFTMKGKDKGGLIRKQDNDDKEKDSTKDDKSLQQFNKNVSYFLVNLKQVNYCSVFINVSTNKLLWQS